RVESPSRGGKTGRCTERSRGEMKDPLGRVGLKKKKTKCGALKFNYPEGLLPTREGSKVPSRCGYQLGRITINRRHERLEGTPLARLYLEEEIRSVRQLENSAYPDKHSILNPQERDESNIQEGDKNSDDVTERMPEAKMEGSLVAVLVKKIAV
ncbi:hypothetical protein HNY73_011565, partial [Argiope bruennichi]